MCKSTRPAWNRVETLYVWRLLKYGKLCIFIGTIAFRISYIFLNILLLIVEYRPKTWLIIIEQTGYWYVDNGTYVG